MFNNFKETSVSKLIKGACAVSALALACAAHAVADPASWRLNLKGHVQSYCSIVTDRGFKPNFDSEDDLGGKVRTDTGMDITIASFANPDATGVEFTGHGYLYVKANAQCNYVLKSRYGALKNQQQAGKFRPYYADAYPSPDAGVLTYLNSLPSDAPAPVSSFSVPPPSAPTTTLVNIDVYIPPWGVLAAGDYQDSLILTITSQ
jgi:hypothetical protein